MVLNPTTSVPRRIVVTGANGFIGRNVLVALSRRPDLAPIAIVRGSSLDDLRAALDDADTVIHLAGVNRPRSEQEFEEVNSRFTTDLVAAARRAPKPPAIVFASSTQAAAENPYGRSKRAAEDLVQKYGAETGAAVAIYRLPGVFGKWCRPNYNSVVATFCHNTARDIALEIHDPAREIDLVYVDDVVAEFVRRLDAFGSPVEPLKPTHRISLRALADLLAAFRSSRQNLQVPDFSDPFVKKLYATYVSYLPEDRFAYDLLQRTDNRGVLAELLKSRAGGQLFVSRTKPGITRGNHYHDTKVEKFCVVEGDAVIRFRHIERSEVIEYRVSGRDFRVVDIPPGYTHSIENIGESEMIVLFWASEEFDPQRPDTHGSNVFA